MDPKEPGGLPRGIPPAVEIGPPIVEGIPRMEQIGLVLIKPHFQRPGKHVNKLLAIVRMGLFVSGTGLYLAQNRIHHMLAEGTERIHGDPRVAVDVQRLPLVLFHQIGIFLCRLKKIQGALAVKMSEVTHEFQRDIPAVFQLAQMGDGDSDLTADFFESITLLRSFLE